MKRLSQNYSLWAAQTQRDLYVDSYAPGSFLCAAVVWIQDSVLLTLGCTNSKRFIHGFLCTKFFSMCSFRVKLKIETLTRKEPKLLTLGCANSKRCVLDSYMHKVRFCVQLFELNVGEQGGEWGKQVGSMNEESQVSGCYTCTRIKITFIYTNQETV